MNTENNQLTGEGWEYHLRMGLRLMLEDLGKKHENPEVYAEHTAETPQRVVKAYREFFSGMQENPRVVLQKSFGEGTYDEMITVANIDIVSFCSHHLLPFFGKARFGYVPHKRIVGLSKIPRFIGMLAARPQVQERLSEEIVQVFMEEVQPKGCGIILDCQHMCMSIRGVKKHGDTRTTALRGCFTQPEVRAEFLSSIGERR